MSELDYYELLLDIDDLVIKMEPVRNYKIKASKITYSKGQPSASGDEDGAK